MGSVGPVVTAVPTWLRSALPRQKNDTFCPEDLSFETVISATALRRFCHHNTGKMIPLHPCKPPQLPLRYTCEATHTIVKKKNVLKKCLVL